MSTRWDVVVVGGGNAGMSAAHSAREHGARVLVLEKAPRHEAGGNSFFSAGAIRTTHEGLADLQRLVDDLTDEQVEATDLPPYRPDDFLHDMQRVTGDRCDPALTRALITDAGDTAHWLHAKGIKFRLMYDRQSFRVNGRYQFWGGLTVGTVDGGKGLMEQHMAAARESGIVVRYDNPVVGLLRDEEGAVCGVRCRVGGRLEDVAAGAVVLAAGGFEASAEMRAQHLGPEWSAARVRGTPHNTGEVLRFALEAGAEPYGDWKSCHAIAWDVAAPSTGDWELTNLLSRQSYPVGIVVNHAGRRFLDEGADFRNYTYAKYGAEILKQPGSIAHQLFDAKTRPLLREDEYSAPGITQAEAPTVRELADALGVDPDTLEQTVEAFNASVTPGEFNPAVRDGKATVQLEPPKSNWALPLDEPPYYGFSVTCGITFTFGGLHIDLDGRVLTSGGEPIPGLLACGELVGGIFYDNYPGGSGLMAGAVFGRRAGRTAELWSRKQAATAT